MMLYWGGIDLDTIKSEKIDCIKCKKEGTMTMTSHRKYMRARCESCGYKGAAKKSDLNMILGMSMMYYNLWKSGIIDRALKEMKEEGTLN